MKTYNDLCEEYSSYLYATITQDTTLYSAPCDPLVDDRSQTVRAMQAGERISVTGMYLNTVGEYWYRVGERIYIRATDAPCVYAQQPETDKSTKATDTRDQDVVPLILISKIEQKIP